MVNYEQMLSDRVKITKPSGIRRFFEMAAKMPHAISLGVGEPDFETPWQIRRAGIQSLEKGQTFYTSNWGLAELRSQIAALARRKYQLCYDADKEILVTVGGSEAIDNTIRALVNPGEEVLIPEPSFVCYTPLTQMAGGVPVPLPTSSVFSSYPCTGTFITGGTLPFSSPSMGQPFSQRQGISTGTRPTASWS